MTTQPDHTTSNEYREFWIQDLAEPTYRATDVSVYDEEVNPSVIDEWHVIEHSAYADLQNKLELAKSALEFYARGGHYYGRECLEFGYAAIAELTERNLKLRADLDVAISTAKMLYDYIEPRIAGKYGSRGLTIVLPAAREALAKIGGEK